MLESRRGRVVVVGLLLGALFGLTVWYGSLDPDPSVGAYPGPAELGANYAGYEGDRVQVWGIVVETDPVVLRAEYGLEEVLRLRLVGLDGSITVGEGLRLNVYGLAEADRTLRVLNAVRVPAWGVTYTYAVSFLAGIWVLGRLVRGWRVELGSLAFVRRSRPARLGLWRRPRRGEGRDDA